MAGQVGSVSFAPDVASAENTGARQVYNFWNGSGAAIADGEVVCLDNSVSTHGKGTSVKTTTTVDDARVVGVADEAIADLTWGKVVVYGVKLGCKSTGGISVNGLVQKSATQGAVEAAADAVSTLAGNIGVALASASGDLVDLFIRPN